MEGEPKPHRHWLLPLRMLLAGLLITVCTGGAVATAGLLQLKDFTDEFRDLSHEAPLRKGTVERAAPGKPQTILLVGSDHRFGDGKDDARSDTMMLVRIDPDQSAITVLSVPRDLAVEIPGRGLAKINEAYTLGGLDLVARTIKDLLGKSQRFPINHAITTTFGGFVQAVNQIGCVYVDVDRRYYHSNLGQPVSEHYAEINVRAGYQELCGTRALQYVRFRHLDNDIVRAARQQDFLRAAKDQLRDQGGCCATCGRWRGSSPGRRRPTATYAPPRGSCGWRRSSSARAASRSARSTSRSRSSPRARPCRTASSRSRPAPLRSART